MRDVIAPYFDSELGKKYKAESPLLRHLVRGQPNPGISGERQGRVIVIHRIYVLLKQVELIFKVIMTGCSYTVRFGAESFKCIHPSNIL